jgi:hypothetical protein
VVMQLISDLLLIWLLLIYSHFAAEGTS